MKKEAAMKIGVHLKFDDSKLSDQQAIDKLEEILMEMDEALGDDVAINVERRYIEKT